MTTDLTEARAVLAALNLPVAVEYDRGRDTQARIVDDDGFCLATLVSMRTSEMDGDADPQAVAMAATLNAAPAWLDEIERLRAEVAIVADGASQLTAMLDDAERDLATAQANVARLSALAGEAVTLGLASAHLHFDDTGAQAFEKMKAALSPPDAAGLRALVNALSLAEWEAGRAVTEGGRAHEEAAFKVSAARAALLRALGLVP